MAKSIHNARKKELNEARATVVLDKIYSDAEVYTRIFTETCNMYCSPWKSWPLLALPGG